MAVDWDRSKARKASAPETARATAVAIAAKGIYRTSDSGAERTVTPQAEESVSLGDNTLDLAR
jgi:SLT domain-containing protein